MSESPQPPRTIVARVREEDGRWLRLEAPTGVLEAWQPSDVAMVLADAERAAIEDGCYVVGYVTYEAGAAFGLATRHQEWRRPLAWFACFPADRARDCPLEAIGGPYRVGELQPTQTRAAFAIAVATIKEHLAAGDTYQVNYTFRLRAPFSGDPEALFVDLVARQRGEFAAYLQVDDWAVCCASPELFFERDRSRLRMRPMKGTTARGRTVAEDAARGAELRSSVKQRAENVMIVDMVRNDLGRVAEPGSVAVPELFAVERYPTLWQMTSEVTATASRGLAELFAAIHPCASITGAPKVRTMELIRGLEPEPRGVYTGAIGYLTPSGRAQFAVAIRTAVVDGRAGTLEFGVGSGVVWDSAPDSEYDECLLKARVLEASTPAFELLETIRWSPSAGFVLLDRHLDRMAASAGYFDYPFDRDAAVAALATLTGPTDPAALRTLPAAPGPSAPGQPALRVRLLLAANGAFRTEQRALVPGVVPVKLAIAKAPIDTDDRFLFHKTTRRDVYAQALAAAGQGIDDVVLWNRRGEVTETTIYNLVLETADGLITPPVDAGLLAGTLRAQLLADGTVREASIPLDRLCETGWCWLVNSVQGWRRGILDGVNRPATAR